MRIWLAGIAMVMGLGWSGRAAAQSPASADAARSAAPAADPANTVLEGRVTDWSRRGLALHIEAAGDAWLVSLTDLVTGRAAAATRVVGLPAQDDAAIGALAQAVVDLAAQVRAPEVPRAPAAHVAAPAAQPRLATDDLLTRRRAIRFFSYPELGHYSHWVIQRGEYDQELDPTAFYQLVGRDDLARAYTRRHAAMVGSFVLGVTTLTVSALLYEYLDDGTPCDTLPTVDGRSACTGIRRPSFAPVWAMAGLGAAELVIAGYLAYRPQPIEDAEARALADGYNERLRRQLGASAAPHRPAAPHIAVAPYLGSGTGGLVLAARF